MIRTMLWAIWILGCAVLLRGIWLELGEPMTWIVGGTLIMVTAFMLAMEYADAEDEDDQVRS